MKDNIDVWPSLSNKNRKWEVSLCRLRIGHTLTTHKYLMVGTHQRFCDDCLVPWTVCQSYIEERLRCFQSQNMDMTRVLSHGHHFAVDSVMTFFSMVNLINEIQCKRNIFDIRC